MKSYYQQQDKYFIEEAMKIYDIIHLYGSINLTELVRLTKMNARKLKTRITYLLYHNYITKNVQINDVRYDDYRAITQNTPAFHVMLFSDNTDKPPTLYNIGGDV